MFVVNSSRFFESHRLPIARSMSELGYEIHVVAGDGDSRALFERLNFLFHEIELHRSDMGIIRNIKTIFQLFKLMSLIKPDIVHLITLKVIVLGGIATLWARAPAVVMAVSGLGHIYLKSSIKFKLIKAVVSGLLKLCLYHQNLCVIVQNTDDQRFISNIGKYSKNKLSLIKGSGVDLNLYSPREEEASPHKVVFASRMLYDKGVREYIEAARVLKREYPNVQFLLVGEPDHQNPSTVQESEIDGWVREGIVLWSGYRDDLHLVLRDCTCVVLPSYREGMPKVLLEAAACGTPIVTTDVPGCREAIIHEVTGFLVPPRDSKRLALAIKKLLSNAELRTQMGKAGRELAERDFGIEGVVEQHLRIYSKLCSPSSILPRL